MEFEEEFYGIEEGIPDGLVIADIGLSEPSEFTKKPRPDIGADDPNGQIVNEYLFEE